VNKKKGKTSFTTGGADSDLFRRMERGGLKNPNRSHEWWDKKFCPKKKVGGRWCTRNPVGGQGVGKVGPVHLNRQQSTGPVAAERNQTVCNRVKKSPPVGGVSLNQARIRSGVS